MMPNDSLIEKLEMLMHSAPFDDFRATNGYATAINDCIAIIRQHQADKPSKIAQGLRDAIDGKGRLTRYVVTDGHAEEQPSGYSVNAGGDMGEGPAVKAASTGTNPVDIVTPVFNISNNRFYREPPVSANNAPTQPSEIPVLAGFVLDLAKVLEIGLKHSHGNYLTAATEIFNFIHPYLRTTEPDTSGQYSNLEEMSDEMFVAALQCVVNPMGENLMRKLCIEAAKRLSEPVSVSLEKCARANCYYDDNPPDALTPDFGHHGDLIPMWKVYIEQTKAVLDAAKEQGARIEYVD